MIDILCMLYTGQDQIVATLTVHKSRFVRSAKDALASEGTGAPIDIGSLVGCVVSNCHSNGEPITRNMMMVLYRHTSGEIAIIPITAEAKNRIVKSNEIPIFEDIPMSSRDVINHLEFFYG